MMKEENHMFQGMKRDVHPIKQDVKYLWDARNIRLTNRDNSTMLSITNERGTEDTGISYKGDYLGHCIVGDFLVVFTSEFKGDDYIYRTYFPKEEGSVPSTIVLYKGNLQFNNKVIETLGVVEQDKLIKVYWVSESYQPRVINIMQPELFYDIKDDIITAGTYTDVYTNEHGNTVFDFAPIVQLREEVIVEKQFGDGKFSPGTIQYALSYYNKYGVQTAITHTTPLYYISDKQSGTPADETVANSFYITVNNLDDFEYLRVYSIHRTSKDATPTVRMVGDYKIGSRDSLSFIDNGLYGETIDNTVLLYLGSKDVRVKHLEQKDGTLFYGGITLNTSSRKDIERVVNKDELEFRDYLISTTTKLYDNSATYYYNKDNLNSRIQAGFKTNESYRLGIQFQTTKGEWSQPIFIKDGILSDKYPWEISNTYLNLNSKAISMPTDMVKRLIGLGYKRARTCVVFPQTSEREVLCQGILCPTVYSGRGRKGLAGQPFAMSSWFIRPATKEAINYKKDFSGENFRAGCDIPWQHNQTLIKGPYMGAEIQSLPYKSVDIPENEFYIDENIVNFYSPDLEFNDNMLNVDWTSAHLRVVGVLPLMSSYGDLSITTETPVKGESATGQINYFNVGFDSKATDNNVTNGGLINGGWYQDAVVDTTGDTVKLNIPTGNAAVDSLFGKKLEELVVNHMIYPWHREGSVNNDNTNADSTITRSATLKRKVISNLKFFNIPKGITPIDYTITTPYLFNSNEVAVTKIDCQYLGSKVLYMGNYDGLHIPYNYTNTTLLGDTDDKTTYYELFIQDFAGRKFGAIPDKIAENNSLYDGSVITNIRKTNELQYITNEGCRIKYKTIPHLVFSLTNGSSKDVVLLPKCKDYGLKEDTTFKVPSWWDTKAYGSSDAFTHDLDIVAILSKEDYENKRQPIPDNPTSLNQVYFMFEQGFQPVYSSELQGKYAWTYQGDYTKIDNKIAKLSASVPITDNRIKEYLGITEERTDLYFTIQARRGYFDLIPLEDNIATVNNRASSLDSNTFNLNREIINLSISRPYVLLAEVVKYSDNKFGGSIEDSYQFNQWIPSGEAVDLNATEDNIIPFQWGDTWYQRYDCLKTYPFTQEDSNSIVEIGSFMCETRVNLAGRTDPNKGNLSNLYATPQNFNQLNPVYSQLDNFNTYRILDEGIGNSEFPYQLSWSLNKAYGEDIDSWTHITLANTIDADPIYGSITGIKKFNDLLVCFQDKAISQILFNSRVQVQASDGVPIEIANGNKVDSIRYYSNEVGCQDYNSIVNTPSGIFFIDNNTKTLWRFNGQLENISDSTGMSWWFKKMCNTNKWQTITVDEPNGIKAFYDSFNRDVYFSPGDYRTTSTNSLIPSRVTSEDALCFSEKIGGFSSFLSYGGLYGMFNQNGRIFSLKKSYITNRLGLHENFVGDYNSFYGEVKPWSFTFISNENPLYTKIFDTIEYRGDTYNNGTLLYQEPINNITVSNEYQDTERVSTKSIKKFRVWRTQIPRHKNTMQRIRNPWTMITLGWDDTISDNTNLEAVIHDVSVKYSL